MVVVHALRGASGRLSPEEEAGTPEPLREARASIQRALNKSKVAALSVAVVKDNEVVWEEGFGWADREAKIPATPETIYRLASLSKPMTATGLMVLVERGLVDLDRPANDYLTGSKLRAYAGRAENATVRHLVYHTSGLPMYWHFFHAGDEPAPDIDASIRKYGILVTAPGEKYTYSNLGYGILGRIISRASGRSYRDFMKEEVFEPLGMSHTSVLPEPAFGSLTAKMYAGDGSEIPPYDFDHRGASAVLSSVGDLVRFARFHLKRPLPDQKAILSETMIDRMHKESGSSFREDGGPTVDYLLGSLGRIDYGGYTLEVASGSMPGAMSRLTFVPSRNLIIAILCNGDNIDLWEIDKALLEAMLPGFGDAAGAPENEPSDGSDADGKRSDDFVGAWEGTIVTDAGTVPIRMTFNESGDVQTQIEGRRLAPLGVATPLGDTGYENGTFKGLYRGRLDTAEARRSPHVLLIECQRRDERVTGYVSAIAINQDFCLPYWMELERPPGP